MRRRDLFKIGAATAAAAPQLFAEDHHHVAAMEAASAQVKAASWQPAFFDAHQNDTVIALTDLIIPRTDTPGAKDVNTNRYLDFFFATGEVETRHRFIEGLNWLDGYAIRKHHAPFVKLPSEQQTAILHTLDTNAEPNTEPGQHFFRLVKGWTARIYYNTKEGYAELNKGGIPSTVGCEHPSHA